MLLCFSKLTAYGADFFALPGLRFPYEIMTFISRGPAAGTDAAIPLMLWRPGLSADFADTFAEIPIMALVSCLSAFRAFAAIPLMSK